MWGLLLVYNVDDGTWNRFDKNTLLIEWLIKCHLFILTSYSIKVKSKLSIYIQIYLHYFVPVSEYDGSSAYTSRLVSGYSSPQSVLLNCIQPGSEDYVVCWSDRQMRPNSQPELYTQINQVDIAWQTSSFQIYCSLMRTLLEFCNLIYVSDQHNWYPLYPINIYLALFYFVLFFFLYDCIIWT